MFYLVLIQWRTQGGGGVREPPTPPGSILKVLHIEIIILWIKTIVKRQPFLKAFNISDYIWFHQWFIWTFVGADKYSNQ